MPISPEMRRLMAKWRTGSGWPKRADWIEIDGIRGWTAQRFEFRFPIMALTGENGVGKSTVLQCAAAIYQSPTDTKKDRYASEFFPDTAWDHIRDVVVTYAVREGTKKIEATIRKPGERWRGNPERPEREVEYIDLSRIQPVSARVGYTKLANAAWKETRATPFEKTRLSRFSEIMGRVYDLAKMAVTDADSRRLVPVLRVAGSPVPYSGFHQGAGETTIAELIQADLPQYGIVLIDEIETSLHPRAQRRLIRDLADRCRDREIQVVLTTHSPYVLDELPLEARAHILQTPSGTREIMYGVSPEFAMSKMDDIQHYECDVYVEDRRAEIMLIEILAAHRMEVVPRCQTIPYGASSVGQALGQMVSGGRFPRPSVVFLDGDEGAVVGCHNLPGDDTPERVVFEALRSTGWLGIAERTGRSHPLVVDACSAAMALTDHHEWVNHAAVRLVLGGDMLWQALCAQWAKDCLTPEAAVAVVQPIEDAITHVSAPSMRRTNVSAPPPPTEPHAPAPSAPLVSFVAPPAGTPASTSGSGLSSDAQGNLFAPPTEKPGRLVAASGPCPQDDPDRA